MEAQELRTLVGHPVRIDPRRVKGQYYFRHKARVVDVGNSRTSVRPLGASHDVLVNNDAIFKWTKGEKETQMKSKSQQLGTHVVERVMLNPNEVARATIATAAEVGLGREPEFVHLAHANGNGKTSQQKPTPEQLAKLNQRFGDEHEDPDEAKNQSDAQFPQTLASVETPDGGRLDLVDQAHQLGVQARRRAPARERLSDHFKWLAFDLVSRQCWNPITANYQDDPLTCPGCEKSSTAQRSVGQLERWAQERKETRELVVVTRERALDLATRPETQATIVAPVVSQQPAAAPQTAIDPLEKLRKLDQVVQALVDECREIEDRLRDAQSRLSQARTASDQYRDELRKALNL